MKRVVVTLKPRALVRGLLRRELSSRDFVGKGSTVQQGAELLRQHILISMALPALLGVKGVSGRSRHMEKNRLKVI